MLKGIFSAWAEGNIFSFRRWDGWMYLFLYLIVPMTTIWVSLSVPSKNPTFIAGCYFTLIINVASSFYDSLGRWDDELIGKSIKLAIMLAVESFTIAYALVQLIAILNFDYLGLRNDRFLCVYIIVFFIATVDLIVLASKNIALRSALKEVISA